MLLGQQRGWCQYGDLFAAHDRDKGRAQSHFGFAKAYIAADQAVHGARADHVLHHGVYGGALIGGFFKTEIGGECFVIVGAVAKSMALSGRASGINVQ